MVFFKIYALAFALFLSIDMVWLGLLAKNFYKEQLGYLMSDKIRWGAALLFYVLYIGGLVLFVIAPSLKEGSWRMALLYGAAFGLVCYATYDLTNLATLRDWPLTLVICDLIWGAFISGAISWGTYALARYWRLSSL
jgi:uncharacterized membrane protein